ncbi:uncharacterized protein LOC119085885 [Bradysia coprophila]|uniref:uncharacterized protein LOC119085885 n=1 Tax=Bradysia coprophila TaxID=38358 RepID=UPI00187D830E|nr:uncharacterized protein LOC119085885 [Bradysia coprophila]
MCKFNQFLALFVCCAQLVQIGVTSPLGTLLFDDYTDEQADSDYDLHYDERQNGTENYRLNIDGVVIALPGPSSNAMSSVGLLASNYLLELAAGNGGANDEGLDEVENDYHPYDFEVPASGQEDEDNNENTEPVINIPADNIIKTPTTTTKNETVVLDLKPEDNVDAVNDKLSATNKKDLKVEVINYEDYLKLTSAAPVVEETKTVQPSATPGTRQASHKAPMKRKNKVKSRIATLLEYLKRSRE